MKKELFSTPIFNRAAWLMMNGVKLVDIDKTNRGRMVFFFEETEEVKKLQDEFWKQEQIQKFLEAQQLLKTRMYVDNPPMIFKQKKEENGENIKRSN